MKRIARATILVLIALNIILFAKAMTFPVESQQWQVAYVNFFWSQELANPHPYHLTAGFKAADLPKIFMPYYCETGGLRARIFSNLLSLLNLKFSQQFEIISYKNISLVILHLINAGLVGLILWRLTTNRWGATLAGLLFLNSGICLSTLLYPFLNARLLLMTFVLSAWLCLIPCSEQRQGGGYTHRQLFCCFLFLLLAAFTDELAVLLLPLPLIYLWFKDGRKGILNPKILIYLSATGVLFLLLLKGYILLVQKYQGEIDLNMQRQYLTNAPSLYSGWSWITDNLQAFFLFFLPRSFGYWGREWPGITALAAALSLFYLLARHTRPGPLINRLAWTFIGLIALKAVLFPHPFSYHRIIMPPYVKFPSLLFFSYYYTYVDAVLFSLALGLWLCTLPNKQQGRLLLILATLITVLNLANVAQWKKGVRDTIAFHSNALNLDDSRKILDIPKHLSARPGKKAVYLSFPSGTKKICTIDLEKNTGVTIFDPDAPKQNLLPNYRTYNLILPVLFLKCIERGECIISLKNTAPPASGQGTKLQDANYFYDVFNERGFDLTQLGSAFAEQAAITATEPVQRTLEINSQGNKRIIFFVQGAADIRLKAAQGTIQLKQDFGYSYQFFEVDLGSSDSPPGKKVELEINPVATEVTLLGPFLLE